MPRRAHNIHEDNILTVISPLPKQYYNCDSQNILVESRAMLACFSYVPVSIRATYRNSTAISSWSQHNLFLSFISWCLGSYLKHLTELSVGANINTEPSHLTLHRQFGRDDGYTFVQWRTMKELKETRPYIKSGKQHCRLRLTSRTYFFLQYDCHQVRWAGS